MLDSNKINFSQKSYYLKVAKLLAIFALWNGNFSKKKLPYNNKIKFDLAFKSDMKKTTQISVSTLR